MAQVTLVTEAKNYHKDSFTGAGTVPVVVMTATKPVTATGTVVFGSSINYLKLKLYALSSAPFIYVFGWNYCSDTNSYVPQLLCSFSTTLSGSTQSLAAAGLEDSLYEITGATLSTGDAKIFTGTSTVLPGGFILLDTLGCEYIQLFSSTAVKIYALHAGL